MGKDSKSPGKGKTTKTNSKGTKKTAGKSNVLASPEVYKPTIYLDDGQIPAELKNSKVGKTVNLVVTGKIISKSERSDTDGTSNSMSIEVGKIKDNKKGK